MALGKQFNMEYFEQDKEVLKARIDRCEWLFRIADIYNPSPGELAQNRRHNVSLGNYEPDKELPERPFVRLVAQSENGETIEMWFDPVYRKLGPHISRPGWDKGLFGQLKGILCSWQLPAHT